MGEQNYHKWKVALKLNVISTFVQHFNDNVLGCLNTNSQLSSGKTLEKENLSSLSGLSRGRTTLEESKAVIKVVKKPIVHYIDIIKKQF